MSGAVFVCVGYLLIRVRKPNQPSQCPCDLVNSEQVGLAIVVIRRAKQSQMPWVRTMASSCLCRMALVWRGSPWHRQTKLTTGTAPPLASPDGEQNLDNDNQYLRCSMTSGEACGVGDNATRNVVP